MSSQELIPTPATEDIKNTAQEWLTTATNYEVVDQQSMDAAALVLKDIKAARAEIERRLGPSIKQAHTTHQTLVKLRKDLEAPFEQAESAIKRKVGEYHMAELKRQQEAQRKAEEEQRKREEAMRKELEEKRLAEAQRLEAAGKAKEAEAVLEKPMPVVKSFAPPAPVQAPKAEGVSVREMWSAEVYDLLELVKYVAEHPSWVELLSANMSSLNVLARQHKQALNIPGVRAVSTSSVAVRS